MTQSQIILGLLAIGVLTGLRAMTPIAVLCWVTVLGRIPTAHGWMSFIANKISVGVFTFAAIGELIGDKLPNTPSRTKLPGVAARIVFGALCAMILACTAGFPTYLAAILGAAGGIAGTYAGWFLRTRIVAALHCPDWPVALAEDAMAIAGSCFVCLTFHR
jgi:uncharacterized membrane protein